MKRLSVFMAFIFILILLAPGWAQQSENNYKDILIEMKKRFGEINTYQCIFELYTAKEEKTKKSISRYFFKKPKMIRMEIFEGNSKGVVLLYDKNKKHEVRAKKRGFFVSLFSRSFRPEHKKVTGLRGRGIHQSDWGYYIDRHIQMLEFLEGIFSGEEVVESRNTLVFKLVSNNPERTESVAKETLWVCKKEFIPVKYVQYDLSGEKILSSLFKDIKLNIDLDNKLFMKFKRVKER